ncbi:MAG: type II toxin-antitoxin system RelE/ParE family toxin [Anaerolineae bacterium]|nr:type II toxin-antitoxin system RelE/ParE family toxin [Anaerolineae bacterium]MCB9079993.1 type II toxin-antitoxin system RelE/ParE family toxin [Anaerolineaceae bacterium]
MYSVIFQGKAAKQIQKLPPSDFNRIRPKIDALAQDPRPSGVKKLSGDLGYRIRVGSYRILYRVDDVARIVIIYRVRHRRDAYK